LSFVTRPQGGFVLFLVLGPLELTGRGGHTALTAPKLQQLIALLITAKGRTLPVSALSAELWPAGPPPTADTTIRTYVHELRKVFADTPSRLSTSRAGYRLIARPQDVDAFVFDALVQRARPMVHDTSRAGLRAAGDLLTEALRLWRGAAFASVPTGPALDTHIFALHAQWLRALQLRVHIDLLLGRHRDLIGELKRMVTTFPLDDRFNAQLMVALHRCGRRGEALEVYGDHQRTLRAELGADPSPLLRRMRNGIVSAENVDALLTAPVLAR
jgi:DNA-binding SARP family transcriptional activator